MSFAEPAKLTKVVLSGPPHTLIHGYSDSWFSYSLILPLIDKKYHVYVPDQRGHGDSDRPVSGYTFPDFAADVLAFMDAKGLRQATIVEHSMGRLHSYHRLPSDSPFRLNVP